MALENQQLFRAPALPKMGKDSSPLMKSANKIGFSFAKPKLKASKMSFVRVKKAQAIKAEDLKGPETVSTGSLATTLTETNKILAEIQNQLAIDFANRIAEKKQTLKLSRKTGRKKKLGEKEEFVERGTKLQKSANAFGKKVLAPIKSIFDKLRFLFGGARHKWMYDKNSLLEELKLPYEINSMKFHPSDVTFNKCFHLNEKLLFYNGLCASSSCHFLIAYHKCHMLPYWTGYDFSYDDIET